MVDILCPHCEEEIGLDDEASGEFSCPYCEGEFEWNAEPKLEYSEDTLTENERRAGVLNFSQIPRVEWFGHGFSIFMLVFIILCLTSSSYYSTSASGEYEGIEIEIIDYKFGLNSFSGESFGETETLSYTKGIGDITLANALLCEMIPDECSSIILESESEIEFYESWNNAGNILGFFLIVALLSTIIVLAFRIYLVLDLLEVVAFNERMHIISTYGKLCLPFVSAGLLFVGMILFMLVSPGDSLYQDLISTTFPGIDLSSRFGLIVWSSLLLSLVYPLFSLFEMSAE